MFSDRYLRFYRGGSYSFDGFSEPLHNIVSRHACETQPRGQPVLMVDRLPHAGVSGWLPLPVGLVHLVPGFLYGGALRSSPDPAVHRPGEGGSRACLSGERGEWVSVRSLVYSLSVSEA